MPFGSKFDDSTQLQPEQNILDIDLPKHLLHHPLVVHSFRPNVAMVILNTEDQILWCERSDIKGIWQFPQGGVDPGEDFEKAMWRELMEELGVQNTRSYFEIIRRLDAPLCYLFPDRVIERWVNAGRVSEVGQAQHFFLLRFLGNDAQITLTPPPGEHREFARFIWGGPEYVKQTPWFKREVIKQALAQFGLGSTSA